MIYERGTPCAATARTLFLSFLSPDFFLLKTMLKSVVAPGLDYKSSKKMVLIIFDNVRKIIFVVL